MAVEPATIHLIGCAVLAADLGRLLAEQNFSLTTTFLPAGLHDRPDLLRSKLQQAIDIAEMEPSCRRIIIGYGICGQGTVGIRAGRVPLLFPRVQDCIAMFLGSDQAYRQQFAQYPGTFYFSAGWQLAKKADQSSDEPLISVGDETVTRSELLHRYGPDKARRLIDFFDGWKKNYQRAVYIDTGRGNKETHARQAQDLARENGWRYEELAGNDGLLRHLLTAEASDEKVLLVPPGGTTIHAALSGQLDWAFPATAQRTETSRQPCPLGNNAPPEEKSERLLRFGLGIDAGGTYTDAVIYDLLEKKILSSHKALTTRWDFAVGIEQALNGLDQDLLRQIELVAVSTTLATNAIVENEGPPVGLILMQPMQRPLAEITSHLPACLVRAGLDITGEQTQSVDTGEVRAAVSGMIERHSVAAFAVSGFAGSINPVHELQVKEIIEKEFGMTACCGHELSDLLDFSVRAATAVLNARIIPLMVRFFHNLEELLEQRRICAPLMVVKGDGTLMSAAMARTRPVETILSGPAASVTGARVLTGLADATVIDMGGTTADIAELRAGQVAVCAQGASVGGQRTHVRALDMRTVGLGGDSLIRWQHDDFVIGPRRVLPLVHAATLYPADLAEILANTVKKKYLRGEQKILLALPAAKPIRPLSGREKQLYDLLRTGPQTPEQAAAALGLVAARFLPLSGLEQTGLVMACGLTPTDLLHVQGMNRRWPEAPAAGLIARLAQWLHLSSAALLEKLLTRVEEILARELLQHLILRPAADLGKTPPEQPLAGLDSPAAVHLLAGILSPDTKASYRLRAEFSHPLVGAGAPVGYFLPQVAQRFSCPAIIVPGHEIANALGAINSEVVVRQRRAIKPDGLSGFIVEGAAGVHRFASLDEAQDWAVANLQESIRRTARHAGTSCREVEISTSDRVVTAAGGIPLFLERIIKGVLCGCPDPAVFLTKTDPSSCHPE